MSQDREETINEAARFELAARIYQRLIDSTPSMAVDQVADLMMKITQATQNRRACIGRLGLNGAEPSSDPWTLLDQQRAHEAASGQSACESSTEPETPSAASSEPT
ncbi:MAG: hypothetical protein HQ582_06475 [Planctomycetes bacterium]|nr:hypothetical protein [Planctomycetota bacterium]